MIDIIRFNVQPEHTGNYGSLQAVLTIADQLKTSHFQSLRTQLALTPTATTPPQLPASWLFCPRTLFAVAVACSIQTHCGRPP